MNAWKLIGVAALGFSLAACPPPEERAEQAREAIRHAIEQGDRAAALDAVEELRDSLPDSADSLLEVAQLLVQSGDAPRAGWLLEEGVQRFPDRDDLRLGLARVSLLLGNPSRAREAVLPIAPGSEQHAAALITRAQAELNLGDLEEALATLADAEQLYPDQPEARLVRISTLLSEHRQDEARAAIEEARAALAGDEDETVALRHRLDLTLAQIQAQQGDPEAALVTLQAMVESDASDVLAWRALAQVLAQQERAEELLPKLAAALEAEEPPTDLYALVAQLHAALGHEDEAEAALRTFVDRSESPAAFLPLVELHSARGDAEAARAVLDEALERYPDEATLRLLRTETLLAEEQLDEARAESARFREATFQGDPQLDYLEARLQLADGDASGAADRLRKLAPQLDRAATQFWLGRALELSGDLEGARRRYSLAQQRDPSWTAPSAAPRAPRPPGDRRLDRARRGARERGRRRGGRAGSAPEPGAVSRPRRAPRAAREGTARGRQDRRGARRPRRGRAHRADPGPGGRAHPHPRHGRPGGAGHHGRARRARR
jgi:predicted Zn-dependent protease